MELSVTSAGTDGASAAAADTDVGARLSIPRVYPKRPPPASAFARLRDANISFAQFLRSFTINVYAVRPMVLDSSRGARRCGGWPWCADPGQTDVGGGISRAGRHGCRRTASAYATWVAYVLAIRRRRG